MGRVTGRLRCLQAKRREVGCLIWLAAARVAAVCAGALGALAEGGAAALDSRATPRLMCELAAHCRVSPGKVGPPPTLICSPVKHVTRLDLNRI